MTKNREIAVIGAGLMGHGIALVCARAGYHVHITDPTEEVLNNSSSKICCCVQKACTDTFSEHQQNVYVSAHMLDNN